MQSNYSTAKGSSTPRKRYRNNGYTDHDNPLHRPGGASKAGLDQTFSQGSGLRIHLLPREAPAAAPTPLGRPAINRWAIDTGPRLDLTHRGGTPGNRPLRRRRAQDHHGQRTAGSS